MVIPNIEDSSQSQVHCFVCHATETVHFRHQQPIVSLNIQRFSLLP